MAGFLNSLYLPHWPSGSSKSFFGLGSCLSGESNVLGFSVKAHSVWCFLKRRFAPEAGAVATEYALLLMLIALIIILSATALGIALSEKYSSVSTCVSSAPTNC